MREQDRDRNKLDIIPKLVQVPNLSLIPKFNRKNFEEKWERVKQKCTIGIEGRVEAVLGFQPPLT